MRLTDRLLEYLAYKEITVYAFEKTCGVGNGYLGKQSKGKGSVGSDILEKIGDHYPDLNLGWLITGKGKMLQKPLPGKKSESHDGMILMEEAAVYKIRNKLVEMLKEQLKALETSLPGDKSKTVKRKRRVKKIE